MVLVELASRDVALALGLGPALVELARARREPVVTASEVSGPAVLLGAHQRAGRVLDLDACARDGAPTRVLRRATSGPAAHVAGRALVFSLALPDLAALVPDATPRTLLNRNVRGFLHGFTRAGAAASYFGRDWVAVKHRPAALLAYDVAPDGCVLLEVVAGYDAPFALPDALATPTERATDRFLGKDPVALAEATGARRDPLALAARVIEGLAAKHGVALSGAVAAPACAPARDVTGASDPHPATPFAPVATSCAIGRIDAVALRDDAASPALWLGGDVLAPRAALDALARALAAGAPVDAAWYERAAIDGARPEDFARAARDALALAHAPGRAPD